jgi:hypothetical protein
MFFLHFQPYSKRDLVFIYCLVIFKLFTCSSLAIGFLLGFSLRFDKGLSVSFFYWLLLALTIVVFLPSVQNYIKTTYGSRCYRYLGWNPGSAAMNGGRFIAGTGAGLAGAGALDVVVSTGANFVENVYGERQHDKNVAAYEKHIEKVPHSEAQHPGPYVQKPVVFILQRISSALGIIPTPSEPPKPDPQVGKNWGL